jgi:hypothetical protein
MSFEVLFKKRIIDEKYYSLGEYESYTTASVVAKGEYYYRGGCTPVYKIIKSSKRPQKIPEHLYPILIRVVGFLTSDEQEIFKNHHLDYLKKKGLI